MDLEQEGDSIEEMVVKKKERAEEIDTEREAQTLERTRA